MERPRERSDPGASSLSIRGFLSRGLSIGQNSSRMNINLLRGSWFQALTNDYFSRVFRFGTRARKAEVGLLSSSLWRIRPIFSPVAAADDYPRLPLSANHPTFILGSELPLIYTPSLAPGVGSATLSCLLLVRFPNCIVYSWVYNTQKTVKFDFDCFHSLH